MRLPRPASEPATEQPQEHQHPVGNCERHRRSLSVRNAGQYGGYNSGPVFPNDYAAGGLLSFAAASVSVCVAAVTVVSSWSIAGSELAF